MPSRIVSGWLCLLLVLAGATSVRSEDAAPKEDVAKKYRELVQQLASPNEPGVTRNRAEGSVKFPAGYDVQAQKRIDAARQKLYDNFEQALPFLVEALSDNRYSMTIDWGEGETYYNRSVGSICRSVIASQLEVYRDEIAFSDPRHWNRYNYSPISKEWWETRKGRSLAELQVEAIDWAIAQRIAEPVADVRKGRENEVATLKKLRDEIAKSGKAAKGQRMLPMVTSDR